MPATIQKKNSSSNQVVSFSLKRKSAGFETNYSPSQTVAQNAGPKTITLPISTLQGNAVPAPVQQPNQKPHLVPEDQGKDKRKSSRRLPFLVRANKAIQTVLVALCGVAICSYGLDVVVSHDVSKLQEQARRLSEQNSELSAQLLKSISYGELQDSVVGRFGLRVPDHVLIVKELPAPEAPAFKPHRHNLPLMSGY